MREASILPKTELHQHRRGQAIAELLGLELKKNGRYDTTWGDKTPLGLYLTVRRFVEDEHEPTGE